MNNEKRNSWFDAAAIIVLFVILYLFNIYGTEYQIRILNNMGIFITLAVSYNLINGFCGVLHLGPNAFIAIGAYASALLTMTPRKNSSTSSSSRSSGPSVWCRSPLWCHSWLRAPWPRSLPIS